MAKKSGSGSRQPPWLKKALADVVRKGPLLIPFDAKQARAKAGSGRRVRGVPKILKIVPRKMRLKYDSLVANVLAKMRQFEVLDGEFSAERAKGELAEPVFVIDLAIKAFHACVEYRRERIKFLQWVQAHPEILSSQKDLKRIQIDTDIERKSMENDLVELDQWLQRTELLKSQKH